MTEDTYALSLAVFDSGEARDKLRGATKVVLDLETEYGTAIKQAAEAEGYYRLRVAEQFRAHRDNGAPVEAANIMARGECAAEKQATLEADGAMKLAAKRLDDAQDTRRSLWRLVEWARDRDLATLRVGQQASMDVNDERAPASRWP